MSTAIVQELDHLRTERGGKGQIKPEDKPGPGYRAVGIMYAKMEADLVEIKVSYIPQLPIPVRDAIAERFGVGAKEWSVTEKP